MVRCVAIKISGYMADGTDLVIENEITVFIDGEKIMINAPGLSAFLAFSTAKAATVSILTGRKNRVLMKNMQRMIPDPNDPNRKMIIAQPVTLFDVTLTFNSATNFGNFYTHLVRNGFEIND